MKDWIEFAGVIALWFLGMAAVVPDTWSVNSVIAVALIATVMVGIYGWRAILERRAGNSHYFWMTGLAVVLTIVSLSMSALKVEGGEQLLLFVFAGALVTVLAFLAWWHWPRDPAGAGGP